MKPGYLSLVLHAHLPYVHDLAHEDSIEQHWLFEAITETYVPLLLMLDKLVSDGIEFRLTFSITPTLAAMLADPLLQSRYTTRLESLMELADKEVVRTRSQLPFLPLARMYQSLFRQIHEAHVHRYRKDLLEAFRRLQNSGHIEIMAGAATHAYLPLLAVNESAVRAQIALGVEHHTKVFGRAPAGFWLPECGYAPGIDTFLDEQGIRFTILETHGITRADERPRFGIHAPVYCSSGVAAFGRDPDCTRQVWSSVEGYPGDYDYREFYRDIAYDLDEDYIKPYVDPSGIRLDTGIKYHRVTGKGDHKEPYVAEWAERKAEIHAQHFLDERMKQMARLEDLMDRRPLIVAPYDAELFGHWWFEGPRWLDYLIRKIAARPDSLRLVTLSEYLKEYPINQTATPCMSSWGNGGFNEVWLNGKNDWIYPPLHLAGSIMEDLSARNMAEAGLASRARNQAARELLLAQASDWAFMINSGNMTGYATRRVKSHLDRFHRLEQQIERSAIDSQWLQEIEAEDNILSGLTPAAAFRAIGPPLRKAVGNASESSDSRAEPLHIVMICPEIVPFAKTGGLADMTGSLAIALHNLGHRVSMVMPAYPQILRAGVPIHQPGIHLEVPMGGWKESAEVLTARLERQVPVYFIRDDRYFDRPYLYGTPEGDYWDNAERFAFFNRAAVELLGRIGSPDILHAHDWQAALAIAFLKAQPERYPGLASTATVLTVHNLGYQGLASADNWRLLDLDPALFNSECMEFYGRINFLKAGLVFADTITTVSPSYAGEIRTPDYGFGLDGVLQNRVKDLVGILNGVDYAVWNPATDPFLVRTFGPDDLSGKQACKADVQKIFGLPQTPKIPLLAIVSRFASQKGLDLVEGVLDELLQKDLQLVMLGSGDRRYQDCFEAAARRYPERIGVKIGFDETLAHKIEAGSDIFLMPSRYEPSGLNQLYSLKYGTIPVVRATGGLKDSVEEFDPRRRTGTGFLFEQYDGRALMDAIGRALAVFGRKRDWNQVTKNAMAKDYSWGRSGNEYVDVYQKLRR